MNKNYEIKTAHTKIAIPISEVEKVISKHLKLDLNSEILRLRSDIKILREELKSEHKLILDLNKRTIELESQLP